MLKEDHQAVERLFKRFEKAGDRAFAEKRRLADQIVEALSKHAAIEEQVFYPVARATVPGTEDVVLESLEEHHIVKWVLSELDGMDPAERALRRQDDRAHRERPSSRRGGRAASSSPRCGLSSIARRWPRWGGRWRRRRSWHRAIPIRVRPTHLLGTWPRLRAREMVDRISDTVSGVAQGSVTAVQDLVALILGRRKRSAAPTGSKAARDTAQDVRGGASKLTDDAIAAAVRAKATASTATTGVKKTATTAVDATKDTVRVAKKSAKRTAATARRSAKRTASTAKRSPATRPPRARSTAKKAASSTRRTARRQSKKATSTTS